MNYLEHMYDYGDTFGWIIVYPLTRTTSEWMNSFEVAQARVRSDSAKGLFCFIAEMTYIRTNPVEV